MGIVGLVKSKNNVKTAGLADSKIMTLQNNFFINYFNTNMLKKNLIRLIKNIQKS